VSGWAGLTAIVTGASGGIGEQLAVQLAAGGAHLALVARRAEELERVADLCRAAAPQGSNPTITTIACDVTDMAACQAMVAESVRRLGRLDVLVNNAGQGMWGRADAMKDLSVYETMLRVNYLSVVWVTLAALPHLKATRGRILGVGSVSGKTGVPLRSGYAAAKHAMTGFLDTLRIELDLDGSGVSVTMIHPGFVYTGSQARNLGADGKALGAMPVRPAGGIEPDECARLLLDGGLARRRDVYPGARAKLVVFLKLLLPSYVDGMVSRAIRGK
jgi:NAD(P)-dependent dehydrogenase (short-subunit alcohol dehydrogenase family)